MNKEIEDLVDLMFDTNMEEVMKEKSTLEYIHKLQKENKQLKKDFAILKKLQMISNDMLNDLEEYLNQKMTQQNLYDYQKLAYQDIYLRIKMLKEKYK